MREMAALSGTPTLQQPNSSSRTTRTTRAHAKLSTKLQLKLTSPSPTSSASPSPSSSPFSSLLQPDLLQNNEFQELGATTVLLSSQTTSSNSNISNRINCNDNNNSKQMNLNIVKQQQQQRRRNGHDVHLTENNNLYNIISTVSDTTLIPPLLKERYKQIYSKQTTTTTTTTAATTTSPNHIIDLSEQITTEEIQIKCEPIMATPDDQKQQQCYSSNENLLNNNQSSSQKNNFSELTKKGEIPIKSELEMPTTDAHYYNNNNNNNNIDRETIPEAIRINIRRKTSQSNSDQPSDLTIKLTKEVEENHRKCQLAKEVSQNCNELNENSRAPITRPQIRLTPTSKLLAPMAVPKVPVNNAIAVIKKKYPCPYENCTKSYGKSSHLRSHLTWHTGIKPFVCKEPGCGKGFTRSDELNRHIRTHTGEKPFECVQCTKKFSRSDHLTKHLATHAKHLSTVRGGNKIEGGRRLKSVEKPTVVTPLTMMPPQPPPPPPPAANDDCQLMNLKKHLNYVDSVQFMAALVEDLKKRQTTTTENFITTGESSNHLEKRPLKIKLERQDDSNEYHIVTTSTTITNPADYRKRKDRQQHNNSMSKQLNDTAAAAMASNMITSNNYLNNFPSPIFASEMKRERYRNLEYEEPDDDAIMPEANLPPYRHSPHIIAPTNLININNSNTIMMDNNTPLYDPGRPFKCVWCMKFFKRQDDLNRHMRVHTGEKPFICNECDKGFKRSDHLKKHMNTHTRIR